MRISIVVAAHNEGAWLWKTLQSCVETCAHLSYELVVADDASSDDSIGEAKRRFPQVRVVRNESRLGASPTKALGAEHARGKVLVFLDGHTKPEYGAIARLAEDVELLDGKAIIIPQIPALDPERWKNDFTQAGHGYYLDLATLACGWRDLSKLRSVKQDRKQFYESPALIGCALAIDRELYDKLWGFDRHMRLWGVEDLDFGLKCWLMGHPILHDPQAVIGHRFRAAFDNFSAPLENVIANQLRMARKNLAPGVWAEWLQRCRERQPERLADHPEGLWAHVWHLFEADQASAEQERAYLQANRLRDEFWYADHFGLRWPRLEAEGAARPRARFFEAEPSPSPPPQKCSVTSISPNPAKIPVNKKQTFTAAGQYLTNVTWTGTGGPTFQDDTGATFDGVAWSQPGNYTVQAQCPGGQPVSAQVTVVKVVFTETEYTTGFTKPPETMQINVQGSATVTPAAEAPNVTIQPSGSESQRISITNVQADAGTGKITFSVVGRQASTPQDVKNNNTQVSARYNQQIAATVPAVVVVPGAIATPHDEPKGPVTPYNFLMDRGTVPFFGTAPLTPGSVVLVTLYPQILTIQVQDQLGAPLNSMYDGATVFEFFDGSFGSINVQLAGGAYQDYVAAVIYKYGNYQASTFAINSQQAISWPTEATKPITPGKVTQNIRVSVGGHELLPSPAVSGRAVNVISPNIINITWP